ncbi:MAG: hypothetical protein AWU54_2247 [Candidatus Frackibacter sp. T328-2]|nr:MAG: hypothetical protein AWU54_2247 [Candidatus Frackibacter sp. T328-2]
MTNKELLNAIRGIVKEEVKGEIADLKQEMNQRFDEVDRKFDILEKKIDKLNVETDMITRQVNENNQILKQDNVKDWLDLGSEVMAKAKEK